MRIMIRVYVDGLCEPKNPGGIAAYGMVVYRDDTKIYEDKGVVGKGSKMSNNVAEYAALCAALSWLKPAHSQDHITIMSDSRLLVNQMSMRWKADKGLYLTYYRRALNLASGFRKITYLWVPREKNAEADELSRISYKEHLARNRFL